MTYTSQDRQLALEELKAQLYALQCDLIKYMEMLDRYGILHPATVDAFPANARKVYDDMIAFYAQAHPDSPLPRHIPEFHHCMHCGLRHHAGTDLPSSGDPGQ